MIIIRRDSQYADKARSYKIIIDGNYYDKINDGEVKNINISSGKHTIQLKIDWCKSNKIDFNASEKETIEFNCGSSIKGGRFLFSIFYATILKNNYLWIKRK